MNDESVAPARPSCSWRAHVTWKLAAVGNEACAGFVAPYTAKVGWKADAAANVTPDAAHACSAAYDSTFAAAAAADMTSEVVGVAGRRAHGAARLEPHAQLTGAGDSDDDEAGGPHAFD